MISLAQGDTYFPWQSAAVTRAAKGVGSQWRFLSKERCFVASALQVLGWDEIVSNSSQVPSLPWCDREKGGYWGQGGRGKERHQPMTQLLPSYPQFPFIWLFLKSHFPQQVTKVLFLSVLFFPR